MPAAHLPARFDDLENVAFEPTLRRSTMTGPRGLPPRRAGRIRHRLPQAMTRGRRARRSPVGRPAAGIGIARALYRNPRFSSSTRRPARSMTPPGERHPLGPAAGPRIYRGHGRSPGDDAARMRHHLSARRRHPERKRHIRRSSRRPRAGGRFANRRLTSPTTGHAAATAHPGHRRAADRDDSGGQFAGPMQGRVAIETLGRPE